MLCGNQGLSPTVVAANPKEPNQFAVGLSDGSVKVIEPNFENSHKDDQTKIHVNNLIR
ncbi:hypothetical protein AALP_AA8G251100 [Arabis alpina]|uniref:Uncharacterized protein n=1 Tax=Arabis alpina TaxID=50452 RepID=A0A087G9A4_ARAAL|nr:hypothetical protein AALP_AA8G251100 [Arabis alpina]